MVLGPVAQVPPGEGRHFTIAGPEGAVRIAVFRTRGGGLHATQADCPHRGGPLADGLVDDAHVICPLHDRIYSLATGAGVGNECALLVYPVREDGDGNLVVTVPAERVIGAGA